MYRLRKKNVANMPSEMENATALPAEKAGILKNGSGIIGAATAAPTRGAPTSRTPPATSEADDERVAPALLVRLDQAVGERGTAPPSPAASPGKSSWRACSETRLADRPRRDEERDDPDRHVEEEHRLPAEVLDHVAAERRSEREREARTSRPTARSPSPARCGGNVTVRIESVPGISSAAPTPWMRAERRSAAPSSCESPHASEAAVKIARPVRNILLRP